MFLDPSGRLLYLMELDVADGVVQNIHAVISPHKLRHLGPLGDLRELRRAFRSARLPAG
jgi:RNA polymerase sigma-70 factor, ECF subfamily